MESQTSEAPQNSKKEEVKNAVKTVNTLQSLVNFRGNPKDLIKSLETVMP